MEYLDTACLFCSLTLCTINHKGFGIYSFKLKTFSPQTFRYLTQNLKILPPLVHYLSLQNENAGLQIQKKRLQIGFAGI